MTTPSESVTAVADRVRYPVSARLRALAKAVIKLADEVEGDFKRKVVPARYTTSESIVAMLYESGQMKMSQLHAAMGKTYHALASAMNRMCHAGVARKAGRGVYELTPMAKAEIGAEPLPSIGIAVRRVSRMEFAPAIESDEP